MTKWTYEKVKQFYEEHGCTLLESEYKGLSEFHKFLCSCGNPTERQFRSFRNGSRHCKSCRYSKVSTSKQLTDTDIQDRVTALDLSFIRYTRETLSKTEVWVTYRCRKDHECTERLSTLTKRKICHTCSALTMNKDKRTPYADIYMELHSLGLTLLTPENEYTNSQQLINYICECGKPAKGYLRGIRDGIRCGCKRFTLDWEEETELKRLRKTPEYKHWRIQVLTRDELSCRKCGDKDSGLEAHHLHSFKQYPELRTDVDNGITFCTSCHTKFHIRYGYKTFTAADATQFITEVY